MRKRVVLKWMGIPDEEIFNEGILDDEYQKWIESSTRNLQFMWPLTAENMINLLEDQKVYSNGPERETPLDQSLSHIEAMFADAYFKAVVGIVWHNSHMLTFYFECTALHR